VKYDQKRVSDGGTATGVEGNQRNGVVDGKRPPHNGRAVIGHTIEQVDPDHERDAHALDIVDRRIAVVEAVSVHNDQGASGAILMSSHESKAVESRGSVQIELDLIVNGDRPESGATVVVFLFGASPVNDVCGDLSDRCLVGQHWRLRDL
jgi:hypothetical protein